MKRVETETVVVGSGPGGATVARELAKKGRAVVLIEKGRWHKCQVGRRASLFTINKPKISKQCGLMFHGVTVGGTSMIFNANAHDPPHWLASELGIDLSKEVAEAKAEIGVRTLPEDFYSNWKGTLRLVEAAGELDIDLAPQEKFIDPEKCDSRCDDCMLGCRRGAKWTSRSFVEEGIDHGARLLMNRNVKRVIVENGHAKGVEISGLSAIREVRAEKVVLAAGGIGTPHILMRSGLQDSGEGFFIDPLNAVIGISKHAGTKNEMTFSFASTQFEESDGFIVSTCGAYFAYWSQLWDKGRFRALRRIFSYNRVMGMFTKIADSPGGHIPRWGLIDKPYTAEDYKKFRKGTDICKKILLQAGASPDSLIITHNIGGHPGGTSAIGRVVDKNLHAYAVKNLYVCDGSVFPRSPGVPPVLTIIGLAKYLAKKIQY